MAEYKSFRKQANKMRSITVSKLLNFRKMGDTQAMAREVARISKQLNQRYYRIEKKGKTEEAFAYQQSQKETGRQHPRYSQNPKSLMMMDPEDLYKLGLNVASKIAMPTSSVAGINKLYKNNVDKAVDALNDKGISITDDKLLRFLKASGGNYLHAKHLSSSQLIQDLVDYTRSGVVSVDDFINELEAFGDAENVNYADFKDRLQDLVITRQQKKATKGRKTKGINSGSRQRKKRKK